MGPFERALLGLAAHLRTAFVERALLERRADALADELEALCRSAEQAEPLGREAVAAVVEARLASSAAAADVADAWRRIAEEAAGRGLWALDRVLHVPARATAERATLAPPAGPARVGPRADGRELTLGARKTLARRGDRATLARLLADPHPDVVARALTAGRLTEEDVVHLAAERPARPLALLALGRTRWIRSARVRLALVMNPGTPEPTALPLVALLVRPELELVASEPSVPGVVRARASAYLERRPPGPAHPSSSSISH